MNIQGRDCTLTVARDGTFIPLPYSEETVRQTSKGYSLPCVIGKRNRDKFILSKKAVTGCFVTRMDFNCVEQLFLLLFYDNEVFDIYTDRVYEKAVYKNLTFKSFELRATNGDAFKFHLDVKETENTYIENWPVNLPALPWISNRTYIYDGHTVTADNKRLPLIYRFELTADFNENAKYRLKLYFPLKKEFYPGTKKIEKLSIVVDILDGVSIDFYDLIPLDDLCDINCADTVLCNQTFNVSSHIVFNIRNQDKKLEVVL